MSDVFPESVVVFVRLRKGLVLSRVVLLHPGHDVLDGTAQVNSGTAGGVEIDGHVPLDGNDAVAAGWTGSFRVLQDLGETMDQL